MISVFKKMLKTTTGIICVLTLIVCPCTNSFQASTTIYQGIDVSEWQGDIDFSSVYKDGIEIVYIRAGEGSDYTDSYFEKNYQNAKEAGLKLGYYHYVTATSVEEAKEQAQFFYSLIKDKTINCYPAMDFESFSGLTTDEINEIALAYLEELENLLGFTPALYSDADDTETIWEAVLSKYPLWVADYDTAKPDSTGDWNTWYGFQYEDTGTVSGIDDDVDLDYFKGEMLVQSTEKTEDSSTEQSSTEQSAEKSDESNSKKCICYLIQYGDTLWGISRKYNTTVQELAEWNHIKNPNLIYAGRTLIIK